MPPSSSLSTEREFIIDGIATLLLLFLASASSSATRHRPLPSSESLRFLGNSIPGSSSSSLLHCRVAVGCEVCIKLPKNDSTAHSAITIPSPSRRN